jgi:peptide/nickel transport system substrate-binding protein
MRMGPATRGGGRDEGPLSGRLTRQQFVKRSAASGAALAVPGLLAACGGGDGGGGGGTAAGGGGGSSDEPLRVATAGGSAGDTIDPGSPRSPADLLRILCLNETLYELDGRTFKAIPRIAESHTSNKAGDEWTINLRDGVKFHDGRPVTAEDVLFTITRLLDPKNEAVGTARMQVIDMDKTKVLDDKRLRFVLKVPTPEFPTYALSGTGGGIVPADYKGPENHIGAGPWRLESFEPGKQSVFVRFEDHYRKVPDCKSVVIVDLSDDAARINALQSGQVHAINNVPFGQVDQIKKTPGMKIHEGPTGLYHVWSMRVDKAPFDDVRVRQAMRLAINRQQLVDVALSGHGEVGHDLYSRYDACYPEDLAKTRTRDVEQARALLQQAGGAKVELVTANIAPGVVAASEIIVQNAKEAGFDIKLRQVDAGTLEARASEWTFAPNTLPSQPFSWTSAILDGPDAGKSWNFTHFSDEGYNRLYERMVHEFDLEARCVPIREMYKVQFERGGQIIPYFTNVIDAYSSKVTGFRPPDPRGTSFGAAHLEYVHFT